MTPQVLTEVLPGRWWPAHAMQEPPHDRHTLLEARTSPRLPAAAPSARKAPPPSRSTGLLTIHTQPPSIRLSPASGSGKTTLACCC